MLWGLHLRRFGLAEIPWPQSQRAYGEYAVYECEQNGAFVRCWGHVEMVCEVHRYITVTDAVWQALYLVVAFLYWEYLALIV